MRLFLRLSIGVSMWAVGLFALNKFWFRFVERIDGLQPEFMLHGCVWPLIAWSVVWIVAFAVSQCHSCEMRRGDNR